MDQESSVILVKAWPQPSQKYGETVCCAGITPEGEWRRLFPIRFRHLTGEAQFKRWDVVRYQPHRPREDRRPESRAVDEPSLAVTGVMASKARADFLAPLIKPSIAAIAAEGGTLGLVRPTDFEFTWKAKPNSAVEADRQKREKLLSQGSLFERELQAIEPCPYDLRMRFSDKTGAHDMGCGDWETAATFFKWRRAYGEVDALRRLKEKYEGEYQRAGVAFAFGTMAKHPQTWLLLGIIRLDPSSQLKLL